MANQFPNYVDNQIGKEEVPAITDVEVENELNKMLEKSVNYVEKEGKAELGDTANIDFEGFLEGVPFEGGKGEHYDLELGSGSFIPGFEEQLVGHEKGEDVDVNVTFPEEYHAENLKGKAVVFKCKIHEIKKKVQAELNDEFAKKYGLPNIAALKEALKNKLNDERINEAKNRYLEKLMDKLIEGTNVDFDEKEVDAKKENIRAYYAESFARYGMTIDSYIEMAQVTKEQFEEQLVVSAKNSLKGDAILEYVANKENLHATEEEINREIELIKNYYHLDETKLAEFVAAKKDEVTKEYTQNKVSNFLYDHNN